MRLGINPRIMASIAAALLLSQMSALARAEIATSGLDPDGNGTYLMWVEAGRVFRAECQRDSRLYDHAHCQKDLVSAPAAKFFPRLAAQFGVAFAYFEQDAQEAWIKIQRIDTRLFELVNGEAPTEPNPVTPEAIDQARRLVDAATLRIAELRDQIGRIEQALRQDGGDSTDLEQLALDRAELIRLESQRTPLEAELIRLRQTYVQQRARQSDANYRDLVGQRSQQVDSYHRAKYYGGLEIKDMECGELIASRIQETGYVWETICNTQSQANLPHGDIGGAYAAAEIEDRTYAATSAPGVIRRVDLVVPRDGRIQAIECSWGFSERGNWEGSIYVYGPGGMTADVGMSLGNAVAAAFRYHADESGNIYRHHFADVFRSLPGRGTWAFEVHPRFVGGTNEPTLPGRCSVTLRSAARP